MISAGGLFGGAGGATGAGIPCHWTTILFAEAIEFEIITKKVAELLDAVFSKVKIELVLVENG